MPAPASLQAFQTQINEQLRIYFDAEILLAQQVNPSAVAMIETIKEFTLRGGKRVRPAIMFLAYQCFTAEKLNDALQASMSIELMETSLLIHDDIMDNAPLRRGGTTVHLHYQQIASDAGYGRSSAILAGNVAGYLGTKTLIQSNFPDDRKLQALAFYQQVMTDECYGQLMDLNGERFGEINEQQALNIIYYKTIRYTFDAPLCMGASLAGAPTESYPILILIARELGNAFQIGDDILGVYGDEQKTGKSSQSDISEGKQTVLILHALKHSTQSDQTQLKSLLGKKNLTTSELHQAQKILQNTGSKQYALDLVKLSVNRAKQLINQTNWRDTGKHFLLEIADYLQTREV